MRAGRLVSLLLLLQRRGRVTAPELAAALDVSVRTVLRDIEELSGAGVPVYSVRGPNGGFELLDTAETSLPDPESWRPTPRRPGKPRRAKVRISPEGRRVAAVLGRLQPLRVSRAVPADDQGWLHATFRLQSIDVATLDVLSIGAEIEVIEPRGLRVAVRDAATRIARLHG